MALNHNKSTGKHYECLARDYLLEHGLILLKANYYCRFGEIDLIMLQQEVLCFIEVKFRNTLGYGGAAAAIPTQKQKKIIKSAQFFLSEHKKYSQFAMRFDAFLIQQTSSIDPEVNWIQNAFYVE